MTVFDVAVIGAGPAGMSAAVRASNLGLATALVEEASAPGGQVYRKPAFEGVERDPGDELRDRVAASSATVMLERAVWNVRPGFHVDVVSRRGTETLDARSLIVATGTHERFVPVPGWTLPGVVGLGAATALMKSQRILPGRNVVVAGAGPLLLLVAAKILEAGGRVAALVDANGAADWMSQLSGIGSRPDLLWQGARWWARAVRSGTPVYRRHKLTAIGGEAAVTGVEIARVDDRWRAVSAPRKTIEADAVCFGYGLCPSTEITRLLGVPHRFAPELGGWVPDLDRERLYVAGDAAGVRGVAAAPVSGELAALEAAHALGAIDDARFQRDRAPRVRELARASRFAEAMGRLACPRPGLVEDVARDTVVCRCEDVSRRQIDAALEAGCRDINQVKAVTRCGMGPCQGRMCGDAVASLIALSMGSRESLGQWTARPPLRPVALETLTGAFAYGDIAMPEHAPR